LNTERSHCIRCGQCCLRSSPTLQLQDFDLIRYGLLRKKDLYTIRIGELVWDNVSNRPRINEGDLIKVRDKVAAPGCCIHYDEEGKGCMIYGHRPSQCVALACWDDSEFQRVFNGPRLERKDIVNDNILMGLIREHENRCGYGELKKLARQIQAEGEKAVEGIIGLLRFDHQLRPFVSERLKIDSEEMNLVFGRPLTETITMFGLKVRRDPDGSFLLTVDQGQTNVLAK
jgi:Fe-S-cluster containining protein